MSFDDLLLWWQNTAPETRTAIQAGCLLFVALVGGHFLALMAVRTLRSQNFDAALRLPSTSPATAESHGLSASYVAGWLVRLTVWAGAGWWLARQHGRPELAGTIELILSRAWGLAAILVASLALGSLLARRLIDCLPSAKHGSPAGHSNTGGAVVASVYVLVVLVVLLMAADVFNWPLTRTTALALWQLTHHLLIAGAAMLIGSLGARWARELILSDAAATPEKRAAQYTALGIIAATTILAVAVLMSSAGVLIGLAALAVLGFLLWLVRGYLPDVIAGLQLRAHRVREVWVDGVAWQVAEIGFLTTQVGRGGEFCRLQNRIVLEARMHAAPSEAAPR